MSELEDRLRGAEARASVQRDPAALESIGASVSHRARRRKAVRGGAAVIAAAVGIGLVGSVGWSVITHDDPIAPEPSPSPSASESPLPTPAPEPSPVTIPEVPYEMVGGVTISQYLPAAEAIAPEVWGEVTSGWTLAAFEGGLMDSTRQQNWDGPDILGYTYGPDIAVPGPKVLYLVSPEGQAYEVANLTEIGVGDVLAWDAQREVALVTDQYSGYSQTSDRIFATLDLRSGVLGPWFSVGDGAGSDFDIRSDDDRIWPIDGGWAFVGHTWDTEYNPTIVRAIVDDSGHPVQGAAVLDPDSTFTALVGEYLVEYSYPWPPSDIVPTLHVRDDFGRGPLLKYAMPIDPHGEPSSDCRIYRLATPEAVVVECGDSEDDVDWQATMRSTVAVFDPEKGSFETIVDWDANTLMAYDSQDILRCVRGDTVYGLMQPGQTDWVMGGLRVRSTGRYEVLSPPPGVYMAIQCEGAAGDEFVVRGSGPLLALDPVSETWRTLLRADGGASDQLVAGVTDLGVFVAP
ncbi:MAG: hypothetical protein MUP36_02135 [Demequinaceae bacterium]|nr:hypothetical protein [Demequinaceae bacterium]